jgi:PKD repeat protein
MQDSLTSAYLEISNQLNIQCAPVGVVWQNILNDTNLVLHSGDNSHPNIDGSYLAALTIFSNIWKLQTTGLSFNAGISSARTQYYQSISDQTIFSNSDRWNLYINNPIADFTYSIAGNTVSFVNSSSSSSNNTLNYLWSFGDLNSSVEQNPNHTYVGSGIYNISLITRNCIFSDTVTFQIQIGTTGLNEKQSETLKIFPNPTKNIVYIKLTNNSATTNYMLYAVTGEIIFTGKTLDNEIILDLSNLTNGLYLLRTLEKNTQPIKIIKE